MSFKKKKKKYMCVIIMTLQFFKLLTLPIFLIAYRTYARLHVNRVGLLSAVGSVSDSRDRGPRFDTLSGHILSFLLLLIQEAQLSVIGDSMCTKYMYWLTT